MKIRVVNRGPVQHVNSLRVYRSTGSGLTAYVISELDGEICVRKIGGPNTTQLRIRPRDKDSVSFK